MRTLSALATVTLDAKILSVRAWAGGWLVVHASSIVVLDRDAVACATHACAVEPNDAGMSDDGAVLVIADADGVGAMDAAGGRRWHVDGLGLTCLVRDDVVWMAQRLDRARIDLTQRGLRDGAVRRRLVLDDTFGDAGVVLVAGPRSTAVIVWLVAGQTASLLVTDDGAALDATPVPPGNGPPPVFAPSGDTYLACTDNRLELRAWPGGDELDECRWGGEADDGSDDDNHDDPAGAHVDYLPGGYGCWSSLHGRLYVLDLAGMFVVDEVVIEGHPLVPVGQDAPSSDFQFAARGPGDRVLSVHAGTTAVVTRLADWSVDPARAAGV